LSLGQKLFWSIDLDNLTDRLKMLIVSDDSPAVVQISDNGMGLIRGIWQRKSSLVE